MFWEYYYSGLQPWIHFVPFWEKSPFDILQVLQNITSPTMLRKMRAIAVGSSAFAEKHLNAHARQCYWRVLLKSYARRLSYRPHPARWPQAVKLQRNVKPLVDWTQVSDSWRRQDDASLQRFGHELEAELYEWNRPHPSSSSSASRAHPRFQSEAEQRSPIDARR